MLKKASLYWHTLRTTKPSQVYYRVRKMLGMRCSIGIDALTAINLRAIRPVATIEELDRDPVFLARFPAEDLLRNKVAFLHRERQMDWNGAWVLTDESALWNYNLHYFEYLLSLADRHRETGRAAYLEKAKECIEGWIEQNRKQRGGTGWEPYTLALRLTNWISFYTAEQMWFKQDPAFMMRFLGSLHGQYRFLARHVEKDLLGNHYFEELKALLLCALFFQDEVMFVVALGEFKGQCCEQILPDGMHFELSPMYHKIILEDIMRVAVALRAADRADAEIERYLQLMLDAAFSLEEGLERIPLFNDCGNNVAKSLGALLQAAKTHFELKPNFKTELPDAGYYIFRQGGWKLIVDAGQPGPEYIPGHAHCDAMSFELFKAGKPVLVNCGTYAYQCAERSFFRSTSAHNTVMREGVEQSNCWGDFRLAQRARVEVLRAEANTLTLRLTDQRGEQIQREITLQSDGIEIVDTAKGSMRAYLHFADEEALQCVFDTRQVQMTSAFYAPEFGEISSIPMLELTGNGRIYCRFVWNLIMAEEGDPRVAV